MWIPLNNSRLWWFNYYKTKINPKDNSLTVELKFNKSNDISQVMFDDEYSVCGYIIDNNDRLNTTITTTISSKHR